MEKPPENGLWPTTDEQSRHSLQRPSAIESCEQLCEVKWANKWIGTYLSLEMRLRSYLVKGTEPEDKSTHMWFHDRDFEIININFCLFCWCLHHPSTGHSSYNIVIVRVFLFFVSFMYFIFLCYLWLSHQVSILFRQPNPKSVKICLLRSWLTILLWNRSQMQVRVFYNSVLKEI